MEKEEVEMTVEHGSLADLSIDELYTETFFGFHAGRLLWPGTTYAMVAF